MSTSLESLNVLLARATEERDEALARLRQAQARALAIAAQHEQLQAYRSEYRSRWSSQFRSGGAIELVLCYQTFADRLEQAVVQQSQMAEHADAQMRRLQQQLHERELRVASVRKLIERRQAEAQQRANRREQKATDESAQRAAMRRAAAGELAGAF